MRTGPQFASSQFGVHKPPPCRHITGRKPQKGNSLTPQYRIMLMVVALTSGQMAGATDFGKNSIPTRDSHAIGLLGASYSYQEPSLGVNMHALNVGLEYQRTKIFSQDRFFVGEFAYATGPDNYSGSGNLVIPKYYIDLKLSLGKDIFYDTYVLSPYIGVGYRFLNQAGGGLLTSTDHYMYDRRSTYVYVPVGFRRRIAMQTGATVETRLEYDFLVAGNQFSGLSVANNNGYTDAGDVNNRQTTGYGLHASFMYQRPDGWSFGPYWKYWNISTSDSATWTYKKNGTAYSVSAWEPANTTDEFGFKAMYKF